MNDHSNLPQVAIVRIDGGVGSQIGQYALGEAIARRSGLLVLHDMSWYTYHAEDLLQQKNRAFLLFQLFKNISIRQASAKAAEALADAGLVFSDVEPLTDVLLCSPTPRFLNGYYTGDSAYLFEDRAHVLKTFQFVAAPSSSKNLETFKAIARSPASVALHVRRGDYLVSDVHTVLSAQYYRNAMHRIAERLAGTTPKFFVFSNGMDWAREALADMKYPITFVDHNDECNGHIDLFLMAHCAHHIISASSFSWWAAFLSQRSPHKIILKPDTQQSSSRTERTDPVSGWTLMPVI